MATVWQLCGRKKSSKTEDWRGWHGMFSSGFRIEKEFVVKLKVWIHQPCGKMKQRVGPEAKWHRLADSMLHSTYLCVYSRPSTYLIS